MEGLRMRDTCRKREREIGRYNEIKEGEIYRRERKSKRDIEMKMITQFNTIFITIKALLHSYSIPYILNT